jgi:glycosyltransferase involved in cell wall biosynthesis
MSVPRRVTIIQSLALQYRLPFFVALNGLLKRDDIVLKVLYCEPIPEEAEKKDKVELPSEFSRKVSSFWLFNHKLLLQGGVKEVIEADLVICEQATKYLWSYPLLVLSKIGIKRFAYWGLGEFKEPDQPAISKWLKHWLTRMPHWWFAYTQGTADYVIERGMRKEAVTVVQNAVDTRSLRRAVVALSAERVAEERSRLGIPEDAKVGLYIGILSPVKQLPFLVISARLIRQRLPNFHLILAGAGEQRDWVEEISQQESWIHYVGPVFGETKALYSKLADACLIPGRVGLAILDAFAAGLPLMTTELPNHGPEFSYLRPGYNGIVTAHEENTYAEAVASALSNPGELDRLKQNAVESSGHYTIEAMAERFHDGILKALEEK